MYQKYNPNDLQMYRHNTTPSIPKCLVNFWLDFLVASIAYQIDIWVFTHNNCYINGIQFNVKPIYTSIKVDRLAYRPVYIHSLSFKQE